MVCPERVHVTRQVNGVVCATPGHCVPAGRGEPEPERPALGGRGRLRGRAARRRHHERQQRAAAGRVGGAAHLHV